MLFSEHLCDIVDAPKGVVTVVFINQLRVLSSAAVLAFWSLPPHSSCLQHMIFMQSMDVFVWINPVFL